MTFHYGLASATYLGHALCPTLAGQHRLPSRFLKILSRNCSYNVVFHNASHWCIGIWPIRAAVFQAD
jgi:hypothetical protein